MFHIPSTGPMYVPYFIYVPYSMTYMFVTNLQVYGATCSAVSRSLRDMHRNDAIHLRGKAHHY